MRNEPIVERLGRRSHPAKAGLPVVIESDINEDARAGGTARAGIFGQGSSMSVDNSSTLAPLRKVESVIDATHVLKYLAAVLRDSEPREFRFIHGKTGKITSRWWDSAIPHSKVVEWIETDQHKGFNCYVTINPAKAGTATSKDAGKLTSDADIARRVWLPIDCDPVRTTSTLATAEQRDTAEALSQEILDWYRANFPDHAEPVHGCSGSGFQILIPCDLDADKEADKAVSVLLKLLSKTFGNDAAKVDTTVSNRSRIMRVLGTEANYKNSDHPGRGWLVSEGTAGKPLQLSELQALLAYSEHEKSSGKTIKAEKIGTHIWEGTPDSFLRMKTKKEAEKLSAVPAGSLHDAHRRAVHLLAGYASALGLLSLREFIQDVEMAAVLGNPACVNADLAAKTFSDAWDAGASKQIIDSDLPIFMPVAASRSDMTPNSHSANSRTVSRTSELSNAVRLLDQRGEDIRFVIDAETFLIWSGSRWVMDSKGRSRVREMMSKISRAIDIEASNESDSQTRTALRKWAGESEKRAVINASADLISTFQECWIEASKLDQRHELLNCPNGTVDLRTGEVKPHSRADLITRVSAVEYVSGATHDLWANTVERFIPDPDVRLYVQKLIGYSLTGYSSEKAFPIFWGGGNNGKGSIFETIAKCVLGSDYAVTMNPDGILSSDKKEAQDRVNVQFMGRRLVVVEETADGDMLNSKAVKSLSSGGDTLAARLLFKEAVNFAPTHSIMLMTNAEPRIDCFDVAMKSRIKFIHFGVTVEANGKIRRQLETDNAVHRAAMAWAVEGARLYLRDGLTDEPQAVQDATERYFASQDLVGQFLNECFEVADPTQQMYSEKKSDVYARYKTWAVDQGLRQPLSKIALGKKLLGKGFKNIGTERLAEYEGLRLDQTPF